MNEIFVYCNWLFLQVSGHFAVSFRMVRLYFLKQVICMVAQSILILNLLHKWKLWNLQKIRQLLIFFR